MGLYGIGSSAWRCIDCVEGARAWRRAIDDGFLDPYEAARREDVISAAKSGASVGAARRLVADLRRPANWASLFAGSSLRPGYAAADTPSRHGSGYCRRLPPREVAEFLTAYTDILESKSPFKLGPFMHRFQLGAIHFDEPIDRQSSHPELVETSLLFGLALFAREHTCKSCVAVQIPVQMPKQGSPVWPLATAFLADAFDKHLDVKAAGNRINQLLKRASSLFGVGSDSQSRG